MNWITAVILCATVIWLAERYRPLFAARFLPTKAEAHTEDPMPADLASIVASFPDAWAQSDASRALYELYSLTKDWNAVRLRYGNPG